MSKIENGNTVSVHYTGKLDDGTKFDSSYDRQEPIKFQVGAGQMIEGFDKAVVGMQVGETKTVRIEPDQAYGYPTEEAVQGVPYSAFPENFQPVVGATVSGNNEQGQQLVATISSFNNDEVVLDFNHPMAGKALNFDIELVDIA